MKLCDYGCGEEAKYQFKNGKWCCSKHTSQCEVSRQKSRELNIGKTLSNEVREKIRKSNKGKTLTEEHKKLVSNYMTNRIISDDTRKKMSISRKGKTPWNKGISPSNETILKQKRTMKILANSVNSPYKTYEYKKKISDSLKGHKTSDETRKKISKSNAGKKSHRKYTISKLKKKYPIFFKEEEMRYNPDKPGEKEIQVHCKNHKCPNSKDHDSWFSPQHSSIYMRICSIEKDDGNLANYFYCSDKCKRQCSLFGKRIESIIKEDQIRAGIIKEEYYTQEEYQTWRQEVLKRSNNLCEYCGQQAEHIHHIEPQKLQPYLSLDPDNGLACCSECHYKYGHKDECSTGNLAKKICL